MNLRRRDLLQIAGAAAALPIVSPTARADTSADTYPARPVRIIVPFGAGGPSDIVTRLVGQSLSARLGQQFIVEDRPGGSGNIGTEAVVRAAPDGYTLLMVGPPNATNATLYDDLRFDFIRDIAPVALIGRVTVIMVVNPSVPAKSVPEFIAYARANPGKIDMGSAGNGTTAHMSGELFKMLAGVELVHVPYRSQAQALADLIAGRVQVMFDTTPPYLPHIKAGELRALAVGSAKHWAAMPELPTIAASVPGYESGGFYGFGAPRGTPSAIIGKLNAATNASLNDATVKARLTDLGVTALPGTPADFGKLIADETEKWGKVIRTAHIKPE
ncbi:MAG TPA: tripartite tricarboxylate transporter substrate binding protein [Xanthobacteraceae bacterium]|nr:tripartite tricarboxylate transporter substrate binding protein [Xanthobacteraceae bacterium]